MIEVQIQQFDPADNHIEAEWRHLEKRVKSSFFTSWDWTGTILTTLPVEFSPSLIRLSEQAETVGLAYLGKDRALRHFLVWSNRLHLNAPGACLTIEDNLLAAKPDLERACWTAILEWFGHQQKQADELLVPGLREPLDLSMPALLGLHCNTIAIRSYHVDLTRLGASNGRFADLLSNNARYQLRRSMRDYGGAIALELIEARTADEALAWFDNMKALHIDSWTRRGMTHAFSDPFFEKFHRKLIQRTFAAGRIQMLRIDSRGCPIGYLYNFRDSQRTYAYQSGFADKDRRLRPGVVSHALAIEHNFRLGAGIYDFLAGTNRLKSSFATDHRDLYWATVQLPRLRFRLENMARSAKRRLLSGDH
jgi:CelD/BcsL family acetyltransferase involved in cellulose biosynthesis